MSKFNSILTYKFDAPAHFEKVEGKSLTIQGESYTVKELFARHMAGQLPNLADESFYEDTEDFNAIDFQKLRYADPFDKAELFREVQEKARKAAEAYDRWTKEQEESDEDDQGNVHFAKKDTKAAKSSSKKAPSKSKDDAPSKDDDAKEPNKKSD